MYRYVYVCVFFIFFNELTITDLHSQWLWDAFNGINIIKTDIFLIYMYI